MFSAEQTSFFALHGFLIVRSFEERGTCNQMLSELQKALDHNKFQESDTFDANMIHNLFLHGDMLRGHLSKQRLREATDKLLCKNAIIYAYQSSSLPPGEGNYGSRIHVDCPRYIQGYRTNLGYILALTPFTKLNGGTWILPGSHLSESIPEISYFNQHAIQITCKQGDAIFFDARLVHRAGYNHTREWRHAVTINFCRPFMRSRFDFPRMLNREPWVDGLDISSRKFLGFDVRMPSSLSEFYLPPNERLYLPEQE